MSVRRLGPLALAAASGALWAACFGVISRPWLGWVALTPFLALLTLPRLGTRHAAALGWVHAVVFWLVSIPWIVPTLETFGALPTALSWFLLFLLAAFLALYRALFAVLARYLLARHSLARGLIALFTVPAAWVVCEWLRGVIFGGFPWNLAAYAWVDVAGALPLAAWVGTWGISYLVVLVQLALVLGWRRRRFELPLTVILGFFLLLAVAGRWSWGTPPSGPSGRPGGESFVLLQPNHALQTEAVTARSQYLDMLTLSRAECDGDGMLVWPESAAWPHSWAGSWELRDDLRQLTSHDPGSPGCDVLLNTPSPGQGYPASGVYYNSALLVSEGEPIGRYDKRKLVPWGEHVPLGDVFPFIGKLARHAGTFTAGDTDPVVDWRGEGLGIAICYEAIFPATVAEQVQSGATILLNISNDAWYGDSSAPRQLFRAARFRAAENRRVMLRAALTGISGVIDRRGSVHQRLELGERGVLRQRVRGSKELSPYTRTPWLVPLLCALGVISGLVFVMIGRSKSPETHIQISE